jgi:hypothetical protein
MNGLSMALAAALLLLPTGQGKSQSPNNGSVLDQVGALQSKLSQWRQQLSGMNLGLLPLNHEQRALLDRERSACLRSIHSINREITGLQGSMSLDLEAEVRIDLDVTRLQGQLFGLQGSLTALDLLAFRTRDEVVIQAVQAQVGETSSMTSGLEGFDEDQLMRQLDAIGASVKPAAPKPQHPGEISGHIYRADSTKPLAGVTVTLEAEQAPGKVVSSVQTAEDGSYKFSGVVPRDYMLAAYRARFARAVYGPGPYGVWATLSLASGQRLGNIDLKLRPVASVTQMNAEALYEAYPETGVGFSSSANPTLDRFSPDTKLFAVVVEGYDGGQQVWLYDLATRHLTPVTVKPPLMREVEASVIAWAGDTLYAKDSYDHGYGPTRYFAATNEATKEIFKIPPAVGHTSGLLQGCEIETPCARNGRFALTLSDLGHGDIRLFTRTPDGREEHQIARGSWELESLIFEPNRSLVLFPRSAAIAVLDLNTQRMKETYLPNRTNWLLAAQPKPGGFLVAYTSYGPCEAEGGPGAWFFFQPTNRPQNVCFATIPFEAKK